MRFEKSLRFKFGGSVVVDFKVRNLGFRVCGLFSGCMLDLWQKGFQG